MEVLKLKETKNTQIKVRITPTERELIDKYCQEHNLTISELIRNACKEIIGQEER